MLTDSDPARKTPPTAVGGVLYDLLRSAFPKDSVCDPFLDSYGGAHRGAVGAGTSDQSAVASGFRCVFIAHDDTGRIDSGRGPAFLYGDFRQKPPVGSAFITLISPPQHRIGGWGCQFGCSRLESAFLPVLPITGTLCFRVRIRPILHRSRSAFLGCAVLPLD